MRKSERLAVTAYHEAGHAVISRKLGLKVNYVTIEQDKRRGPWRFTIHCSTRFQKNRR
jgi:ATP-dependent Zn protease